MDHLIDISREKFHTVCFEEGIILFELYMDTEVPLDIKLEFSVWGIILNPGLPKDQIYVSGYSTISFDGTVGGQIRKYLYEDGPYMFGGANFAKDSSGEQIVSECSWACDANVDNWAYELSSLILNPFAWCHLKILAKGNVSLVYKSEDCIPVAEFFRHPDTYGWKQHIRNLEKNHTPIPQKVIEQIENQNFNSKSFIFNFFKKLF